jgi:hypothetical protein
MVEWVGNLTRLQPRTEPLVSISHTEVNPFGINTFLQKEVEVPKLEVELQMIRDAGFHWLRQEFPWEDIEVDRRGQFTDSRNDHTGDGLPDTIDAWAKYDRIVDLVEKYGLELQVRLSNPPDWAVSNVEQVGSFAPPDDLQDFVNFAVAVAERYQGRIRTYQIWNEPNGNEEWGRGRAVDPEGYTEMLCQTYRALKAVDPEIVVISAALTPTVSLYSDNLNDFIYLQRMYDAGAGACFDVMSAQGYGLFSGPTDRRMRPTTINYARNLYIRDLMVANGDGDKAIWISEVAWNPVGEPDVPRDIIGYGNYGVVTEEQAARYLPIAYQRAQEEWPWIGVINYWFFTWPTDQDKKQAFYYFRMVEPDYSPEKPTFTPLRVYDAMKDYIHNQTPTLYPGVHQAEDWRVTRVNVNVVEAEGAQLGKAAEVKANSAIFICAYGTDVILRWRETDSPNGTSQWEQSSASSSIFPKIHQLVALTSPGDLGMSFPGGPSTCANAEQAVGFERPILLDSITAIDRTFQNLYPLVAVGIGMLGVLLWVVVSAWRERRQ